MTNYTTQVPQPTLGPTGYVIPTEAAILTGVIADIQAAFGGNLNLSATNTSSLTTPQGQLATTFAAVITDCYEQFLSYVAQTDPAYAQGIMQNALGNLYFMTRLPAEPTTISANAIGLPGTPIPANVPIAIDAAGNTYYCGGGTLSSTPLWLTFYNTQTGPIVFTAPLAIYQTIPGWDAITGAVQIQLGNYIETTQAFEARRVASVATNATGSAVAIKAAVLGSGQTLLPPQPVSSAYVLDNPTNLPVATGGITLPANSLYVCAYQGNAAAIAQAIWTHKDIGCSYAPSAQFTATCASTVLTISAVAFGVPAVGQTVMNGATSLGTITSLGTFNGTSGTVNVSIGGTVSVGATMTSATIVTVYDTSYGTPQPSYQVSFTVAIQTAINIQVTLAAASLPPANSLALLQNATTGLGMAFLGTDGLAPISQIGATVFSSRLYPTVTQILPGISVVGILVGTGSPTAQSQAININQIPILGTVTLVLV